MQYFVYTIGPLNDIPPYYASYVGVTNNPKGRWSTHSKSEYTVGQTIRRMSFSYEDNMKIIFVGSESECFLLESKLRPYPHLGLNEAAGGYGGYTKYTEQRNKIISEKLKGRVISWSDKISKTKKLNGACAGLKNPNAKKWKLINPLGEEIDVTGKLDSVCRENNILSTTLRKNIGQKIPPLTINGHGGFRATSSNYTARHNTSGWMLCFYNEGE